MINISTSDNRRGITLAILAAFCYSVSSPLSKLILGYLSPTLMAGFLYLGAGVCMLIIFIIRLIFKKNIKKEKTLTKKRYPLYIRNGFVRYSSTNFDDVRIRKNNSC